MLRRVLRVILGLILAAIFAFYIYCGYIAKVQTVIEANQVAQVIYVTPEPTAAPVPEATPEPTPVPTPEPTVDPDSPEGRALAKGLPTPPDINIDDWQFILANGDNSISEYAPPEIVTLEGQQFDSRIVEPLQAMIADARAQGYSVYVSSGYRDYATQAANFKRICENNGVADGKDSAGHYITMPAGCSEHQTGLCADITDIYYSVKDRTIENTELFKYMSAHCHEFGFILRFPDGQEDITGVMYEPWHYRYVGLEVAKYITENGLTYEEFAELYR